MTAGNHAHFTRCGLPGIELVPFGMHACHFYKDRDELVAGLAAYFAAGLSRNERCLWITAPPLPASEAGEALRGRADVGAAIDAGALRIIDFDAWTRRSSRSEGLDVVQLWLEEEERALADGYSGLRVSGNPSFLAQGNWSDFMAYEQAATAPLNRRRIVALCSYARSWCDDRQVAELVAAHDCAFEAAHGAWQVVASPTTFGGARP